MLYRKMRRDLKKKHLWSEYDSKKVWDLLRYKDHTLQESDFFNKINQIEEISSKPGKSISETEMMELFFFIRGIEEKLIETRK